MNSWSTGCKWYKIWINCSKKYLQIHFKAIHINLVEYLDISWGFRHHHLNCRDSTFSSSVSGKEFKCVKWAIFFVPNKPKAYDNVCTCSTFLTRTLEGPPSASSNSSMSSISAETFLPTKWLCHSLDKVFFFFFFFYICSHYFQGIQLFPFNKIPRQFCHVPCFLRLCSPNTNSLQQNTQTCFLMLPVF